MGGCCCCCSSKGVELNSSPHFYHYPRVSEEHEPLSSHHGTASPLSTGLLVDTDLETSIPDTYRPPPTPMPYDANPGHPRTLSGNREGNKSEAAVQPTIAEPVEETNANSTHETAPKDLKASDCKVQADIELATIKALEDEKSDELKKSNKPVVSALEEEEGVCPTCLEALEEEADVCPTCLEEYDAENPKIITKCEHHFHLSCILEWMERSDTCPMCDKEMIFNPPVDG